ncbi:MAG: DUF1501 domain-containing protein, partial [Roseibacillus sp.]|nr:DUF1501 domain-containing protein [Roseibacillus sp.]
GVLRGKSVVLLFLHGGPPHIEFFDPKMTAPREVRSITGEIKTKLPGVSFGSTFPRLAAMADKFTVVRSYGSQNNQHTYGSVATAGNPFEASMGAIYSKVAGPLGAGSIPNNTLILPEAIDPALKLGSNFETKALPTVAAPGRLGSQNGAFNPSGGGTLREDMQLTLEPDRFTDRRTLLSKLDSLRREADGSGVIEGADRVQQQAFDVLTAGIGKAFDLSGENPRTLARYDTRPLFDQKKLQRWGDMRRASNLLGMQMLMARRLVEQGAGFVTVSDCGWDYHANNNSPKNMEGLYPMGGQVDHAVSAFIEDLAQRGLSDDVLLVVTSEMGRTPKLNNNGGRNHYGKLTSLLLAGGGLHMGQIIGESDNIAAEPATEGFGPRNLMGTIMRTLFNMGKLREADKLPEALTQYISEATPIRGLGV